MYQLHVGAAARGTGTAARLLADAEARLATAGTMTNRLETPDGIFPLEVWRHEKPPPSA